MLVLCLVLAQEVEIAPVTVVERAYDHNPYSEADAPCEARISGDEHRPRSAS